MSNGNGWKTPLISALAAIVFVLSGWLWTDTLERVKALEKKIEIVQMMAYRVERIETMMDNLHK